jgi:hypothetical protein
MVAFLMLVIILAVFAILAERLGVDSRDDSADPRRSEYPIGL